MRLLDPRFKWVSSTDTDVRKTWKRHGFKPTTEADRAARQARALGEPAKPENVTDIAKRRMDLSRAFPKKG